MITNYYYPVSIQDLRNSIERTLDRGTTAFKIAELMDQHGNEDWLETLANEVRIKLYLVLSLLIVLTLARALDTSPTE